MEGMHQDRSVEKKTNVASFNSSLGFIKFQAFCVEFGEEDKDNPVTFLTMACDDEESVNSTQERGKCLNASKSTGNTTQESVDSPRHTEFNLEAPTDMETPMVIQDEEERQPDNMVAEFLKVHQRIRHISPRRIQ